MFLNNLNDIQKRLFQKLAIKAAEANGVVEIEEKNMLKCFAIEMNIKPIYDTDISLDNLLTEIIENSDEQILRIFLFETLAIIISDSEFDDDEIKFIDMLRLKFGIEKEKVDEMLEVLYEYTKVFNKINSLIFVVDSGKNN